MAWTGSSMLWRSMAQTHEGAMKLAARHAGVSLQEWNRRRAAGEKFCHVHRAWHARDAFGDDPTRYDGLDPKCREARRAAYRRTYVAHPLARGESGPRPAAPRDGDKRQARQRVNVEVRAGRRPHPNTLPCASCGHAWSPGERRHEYDHHLGYGAEHHYDVIALCTTCHVRLGLERGEKRGRKQVSRG